MIFCVCVLLITPERYRKITQVLLDFCVQLLWILFNGRDVTKAFLSVVCCMNPLLEKGNPFSVKVEFYYCFRLVELLLMIFAACPGPSKSYPIILHLRPEKSFLSSRPKATCTFQSVSKDLGHVKVRVWTSYPQRSQRPDISRKLAC